METTINILQSFSIIIACWVAIYGINAWRREFIGKRRIELAEEVLGAFFAVKDAIEYIRLCVTYDAGEGSTRPKHQEETEKETEILNRAYIVYERYGKKIDVFNHFSVLKYRFMASFGKDKENIFKDITKILNRIFNASDALRTCWLHEEKILGNDKQREKMEECKSIIWKNHRENDIIQKDIDDVQKRLEEATSSCFEETAYCELLMIYIQKQINKVCVYFRLKPIFRERP